MKRFHKALVAATASLTLLIFPTLGSAGPSDDAWTRFLSGEGTMSDFNQLKSLAEQGDPAAEVEVAEILAEGWGVRIDRDHGVNIKVDKAEAARLALTSAEQGNALGEERVGFWYTYGDVLPRDYAKGLRLCQSGYDKLKEEHATVARYFDVEFWFGPNGGPSGNVNRDRYAEKQTPSDQYFIGAAENALSCIQAAKAGIRQAEQQSLEDERRAEQQAKAEALAKVVAASPGQTAYVKGDFAKAFQILLPFANQGSAMAEFEVGYMYASGKGVPTNYSEGMKWLRAAADQDYPDAEADLAVVYNNGLGVQRDDAESFKWYKKSASHDNDMGQFGMGWSYLYGHGAPVDIAEARKWMILSANQGYVPAEEKLGYIYLSFSPENYSEAMNWTRKAADHGDPEAYYNLGVIYENGKGVPANKAIALKMFHKAADMGSESAKDYFERQKAAALYAKQDAEQRRFRHTPQGRKQCFDSCRVESGNCRSDSIMNHTIAHAMIDGYFTAEVVGDAFSSNCSLREQQCKSACGAN